MAILTPSSSLFAHSNTFIHLPHNAYSSESVTAAFYMAAPKNKTSITGGLQAVQSARDADLCITSETSKHLKGVKALVDEGLLNGIPDAYILPSHQLPSYAHVLVSHNLPLIDMSDAKGVRRPQFIADLAHACEHWGFFQVINHGVSSPTVQRMMDVAKEFFELPLEEKMEYASEDASNNRKMGTTRVGTSFNPSKETTLQWRDHLRHPCSPLPDVMQNWPHKPPYYRQAALEYSLSIKDLADHLLVAISESLGVEDDCLTQKFHNYDQQLAVNYYPPCPNPDLAVGLGAHSDPGGITILFQDDVGGLQVLHQGQWIAVQPLAGCLIVNVGDQMEILTNGRYKSVQHRAVVNSKRVRMSIVSSYNPSRYARISPIKHMVDEHNNPTLYREILYADYLQYFYSKSLDGKSVIDCFKIKN